MGCLSSTKSTNGEIWRKRCTKANSPDSSSIARPTIWTAPRIFGARALGMPVRELPPEEAALYKGLETRSTACDIEVQMVSHPSRVHLDIETDDIEAEVRRLEKLGAKRIQAVHTWWVMEAPTGQRFCVVRGEFEVVCRTSHGVDRPALIPSLNVACLSQIGDKFDIVQQSQTLRHNYWIYLYYRLLSSRRRSAYLLPALLSCNTGLRQTRLNVWALSTVRIFQLRTCRVFTLHLFPSNSPASPGILLSAPPNRDLRHRADSPASDACRLRLPRPAVALYPSYPPGTETNRKGY